MNDMSRRARKAPPRLLLLAIYLVLMAIIVWRLAIARDWALEQRSDPQALAQWSQWREDVRQERDPQARSVQRRVPKSVEPPVVVLMRDYFAICLIAALGFSTLLFLVITWMATGALYEKGHQAQKREATE